jgi:hypothetical protein
MHMRTPVLPSAGSTRALLSATLLAALTLAACGGERAPASDSTRAADAPATARTAPHGGVLLALGDGRAHLEFVVDTAKGVVTAYVLDRDARTPVRPTQGRIDLTMHELVEGVPEVYTVLAGKANPRTQETIEDTSVFIGFVPQLVGRPAFRATVQRVEVAGEVFSDIPLAYPGAAAIPRA